VKNKLLLIFSIIFIFSCSSKLDEINYKEQNKRFDYTSLDNFKKSLVEHFNDDLNRFDKSKVEEIENKFDANIAYDDIIKNNSHEIFVSNNPNKIYSFINFILLNEKSDQIVFESMQSYLRYLTKDKILK
tara:strand:- start:198 stop:587 length:390 start_codon:yes stop_codon:yes gene_type:complete